MLIIILKVDFSLVYYTDFYTDFSMFMLQVLENHLNFSLPFLKVILFLKIKVFFWSLKKRIKTLVTCSFRNNLNFPKIFETLFFYPWILPQILARLTIFGGVRAQENPKIFQFMDAASPQKHLKIYKLATTNAIKMKLTTIVIFMRPFIWKKKIGRGRAWPRNLWKKTKESFFGLIIWNFQDSIKNRIICHTLLCTASLVKILYKSDLIWGCNL